MNVLRLNRRKGRTRDADYMAWIKTLPCVVCMGLERFMRIIGHRQTLGDVAAIHQRQHSPTEAAHVGPRGLGAKCPDRETIPLCARHHRIGSESHHVMAKWFWERHGIERDALMAALRARYEIEHNSV